MSMIHFVGGEKGGVGKSVLSRLLSQYFLDRELHYVALDADQSHPTLTRYYPDFTHSLQLDVFESSDQIMELALNTDQQVLIDLPAQSQRFLDKWIVDSGVLDMCEEANIPLVYWYVVDDGRDSPQLLDAFLQKYNHSLFCIVVKNHGRGADFSEIDALPAIKAGDTDLRHLNLPALHAQTLRKIDKLNFSFWAAINVKDSSIPHLSLMERQRTKVWVKKVYAVLDEALQGF